MFLHVFQTEISHLNPVFLIESDLDHSDPFDLIWMWPAPFLYLDLTLDLFLFGCDFEHLAPPYL